MKILYNRFIKATAKMILLVSALICIMGIMSYYYIYSNDVIEKDSTFQETQIAETMSRNISSTLIYVMDSYTDNSKYYLSKDNILSILNDEVIKKYIIDEMTRTSKNYLKIRKTTSLID